MKNFLPFFLFIACCVQIQAQTVQSVINIPYTSAASPTSPSLLYKPDDYATATSTKYPLLIFLHGTGEAGTDLSRIYNNSSAGGPAYFMEHGGWPSSFTNPMDGQPYKFIVISPQRPSSWSWQAPQLNYFINYMVNNYRVDPNRIYATGLSAGGEGVLGYAVHLDLESGNAVTPIYKLAALVPMAPAIGTPSQIWANTAVADSVKTWGLGGASDIYGDQVENFVYKMNLAKPGIARITRYPGSHCCWGTYYNPNYRENIKKADSSSTVPMNIYEWMLQFTRNTNSSPTANAGVSQTISLPLSTVTLTGSGTAGSGQTISSYGWTKISGPGGAIITSPTNTSTTVTGLTAGTFVFRLTVTNSVSATATDDVTVIVNPLTVHQPPTVTASANQAITLPVSSVSVTSSNTVQGSIVATQWTKFKVPGQTPKKLVVLGSSTSLGTGTTTTDSSYVGRVTNYYTANGIVSSVINLANTGSDIGAALPIGTTPMTGLSVPDPLRNVTAALTYLPDVAIVNFPSNGYNQSIVTPSVVAQEAQIIYNAFTAAGVECYITTTQPREDFSQADQNKLKIIRDTLLNRFGSHCINFYDGLTNPGQTTQISQYAYGDAIHFNNLGHERLFQIVRASNIFQNTFSSSATIITPSSSNTSITGLTPGVHQFQVSVMDADGLAASSVMQVTVNGAANQSPSANAGPDQAITLPTNSVTLNGSGTDPDGTIASYQWTKISGPASYTIVSATQAQTVVNNLAQGVYKFELKVTDNQGATGKDTVQITVNAAPPPPPPSSCVGNKTVVTPDAQYGGYYTVGGFNPGDTILLNDNGGSFNSVVFVDLHGTSSCPIVIMNDPALGRAVRLRGRTAQIALGNCTYVKVTGSGIPAIKYGIDLEAVPGDWTLSTWGDTYFSFSTSGRSKNIEWDRVYGRHGGVGFEVKQDGVCDTTYNYPNWVIDSITIHDSKIVSCSLEGMYIGNTSPDNGPTSYDPRPVDCNGVTTYPRPVRVGYIHVYNMDIDSTGRGGIQLAGGNGSLFDIHDNVVKHSGMNGDEQQGAGITLGTYTWAYIHNNTVSNTYTWSFSSQGGGYTDHPIIIENNILDSAGYLHTYNPDLTINTTTLQWPLAVYFATKAVDSLPALDSTQFQIINNRIGREKNIDGYSFALDDWYNRMQQTGNKICGNTKLDGVTPVTNVYNNGSGLPINYSSDCSGTNQSPSANAGPDQAITLPTNSVTLNGSGTDPDGTIASYQWTKISGPASYTIVSATQAQTVVNNLAQGVYQFQLKVTDNQGATSKDTVTITVNPGNQPPIADAGPDQSIILPTNFTTLTGGGIDPDGTVVSYQWAKVNGPAQYVILSPVNAQTVVNNLVQGAYMFELTVTDNTGATDRDTVIITVYATPPPNQSPTANAGPDQAITLPTNSVTLNGSGTDPDGTIASYQWTKISGPASYTIVSATQAQTVVNNLAQGVYKFELKVTDNQGATGKDTIQITVNAAPPPNQPPTANAGPDQAITLPTNSVTLNGSGTDPDGTIAFYQWTKISGPASYVIVSATQAQTVVNNLVQGVYQFELKVTDNQGATGIDQIQITVNATPIVGNQPPVANAGLDRIITLPANSLTISGSGTDADGTITSYQWTKISGPAGYTIVFPTQAQTPFTNLEEGVYEFELKVTDNNGAVGRDTVMVTVMPGSSNTKIYPNPAGETINIEIDAVTNANKTKIQIFNISGIKMYENEFIRNQQLMTVPVDISKFPKGSYIVMIGADINNVITRKFVKQ